MTIFQYPVIGYQEEYYKVLEISDRSGSSTAFIEFMLGTINQSLRETIEESKPTGADYSKRSEYALSLLDGWFDRKEYMKVCKGISTATASRDIKQLLTDHLIESSGSGRMTKYRKKQAATANSLGGEMDDRIKVWNNRGT